MNVIETRAILQVVEMAKVQDIVLCAIKRPIYGYQTQIATKNQGVIDFIQDNYKTSPINDKDGVFRINVKEDKDILKKALQERYGMR